MLILRRPKKNGNFYISGSLFGQRYRESTGTGSRPHAEAILARRQKEILDAHAIGQSSTITFAEAAEMYLLSGGEGRFLTPLILAFGNHRLIDITQRHLTNYIKAKMSCGNAGINRQIFTPMIAVYRHVHRAGLGPAPTFQRPIVRRKKRLVYATDDDVRVILRHCRENLGAAILTLTLTGARASEVCGLLDEDVDWDSSRITLHMTKNGEPRVIPAPEVLMRALRPLRGRGSLFGYASRFTLNQAIARACKKAGRGPFTSHEIGRHAFAARLLRMGYTIAEVQKAGGWKSYRVVADTYGHLEKSRVDSAVIEAGKFLATSPYLIKEDQQSQEVKK